MADEIRPIFSLGPNKTELEIAVEEYRKAVGETGGLELLSRAAEADDAYKKKEWDEDEKANQLSAAVEWARRSSSVVEAEIERLLGFVSMVSESSFENGHVLAAMLHAASMAHGGINLRINAALVFGSASLSFGRPHAARQAYADVIESLRVASRFLNMEGLFRVDTNQLAEMEARVLHTWNENSGSSQEGLMDVPQEDTAQWMLNHILWNTDFGPGQGGIIPQSDAFARLTIRMEHWLEVQGGDSSTLALVLDEQIKAKAFEVPHREDDEDRPGDEASAQARCASVCGNAFLEVGMPAAATRLYKTAAHYVSQDHPLYSHTKINLAFALYQLGRHDEARETLSQIDAENLQKLGKLVLTVKAEWGRYLAVAKLLGLEQTNETSAILESVKMILGSADGRVGYLRNLYVGQLLRDTNAILALS